MSNVCEVFRDIATPGTHFHKSRIEERKKKKKKRQNKIKPKPKNTICILNMEAFINVYFKYCLLKCRLD